MNIFFMCLIISISLSMDAFSLALVYGTYNLELRKELLLSLIVGIFHFIMPLIGLFFGSVIMKYFLFNIDLIVGAIFLIIGIEMLNSLKKDEEINVLISFLGFLLFGFSVSIDSLTTGIGLSTLSNNYVGVACLFMIVSAIFTFLGLLLGKVFNNKFGDYATGLGGILMIILALNYIF